MIMHTEDLIVGYGKRAVVKGVSLEAVPGRVLTLIGPNGAGKSTILRTITAQLRELGGVIYIDGRKKEEYPGEELAKKMSMVMTDRIRPELMTARDVVATGRYPYTGRLGILSAMDEEKVTEAIRLVHAEEVEDQDFNRISDGQRQRVMLARALCQEAKILILDEPASYLDLHYKVDLLSTIRRSAIEKKIAVIMSLHELEFVRAVSDTVACVDGDRICAIGSPEEILTAYRIEELFHMPPGSCKKLEEGLDIYGAALQSLIRDSG